MSYWELKYIVITLGQFALSIFGTYWLARVFFRALRETLRMPSGDPWDEAIDQGEDLIDGPNLSLPNSDATRAIDGGVYVSRETNFSDRAR